MTRTPKHLGEAGLELWTTVLEANDLRPDELRMLEDACREADVIESLDAERRRPGFKLYATGSMGQRVIDPVISELRQHSSTLAMLLTKLKLTEGETDSEISAKNRAAVNVRWAARRAG